MDTLKGFVFFDYRVKDSLFNCSCGWMGTELDLDVITSFDNNLVCCPSCQNDDVRVLNN